MAYSGAFEPVLFSWIDARVSLPPCVDITNTPWTPPQWLLAGVRGGASTWPGGLIGLYGNEPPQYRLDLGAFLQRRHVVAALHLQEN